MQDKKLPISISLISFNEESNIGRTLDHVQWASEIIVVDSHSTDKTVEIAKSKGAKVFIEDWKGCLKQKDSSLQKCNQPWILELDCDEVVTPQLEQSIHEVINGKAPSADGYLINRRSFYLGKLLRYAWQPDWKLRLIKKEANPHMGSCDPHAVLFISGSVRKLKGDLIHYSYKNLSDHFLRTVNYAKMSADSLHKQGKDFKLYNLIFNPLLALFKSLILRKGFLDGMRGFIVAFSAALSVLLKYMMLWELKIEGKQEKEDKSLN